MSKTDKAVRRFEARAKEADRYRREARRNLGGRRVVEKQPAETEKETVTDE